MTNYNKELKKVNKTIETIEAEYIKALTSIGYQYIDNKAYTNKLDLLILKKEQLEYLITMDNL